MTIAKLKELPATSCPSSNTNRYLLYISYLQEREMEGRKEGREGKDGKKEQKREIERARKKE